MPYTLIHSLSQESLQRTPHIDATMQTQLGEAAWAQLKSRFLTLAESRGVVAVDFLVLDERSFGERTVVVVEKGAEWVTEGGDEREGWVQEGDTKMVVWRKGRVPFEDAFVVQCGIEGFCGREIVERYLVEVIEREVATEEELLEQESTEEESTEEEFSEDEVAQS